MKTEEDEEREVDDLHLLRAELERAEIVGRMRELECSQRLVSLPMTQTTDRHHRGLYGLREEDVVENLIKAEYGKQKIFVHPVSGREKLKWRERSG